MQVGFLFNHDQIHQIAHSLPIATALARAQSNVNVVIATSNTRVHDEVVRLLGANHPENIRLVRLKIASPVRQMMVRVLGKLVPVAKILVYSDNLDFFRSLDALVVTERTSLILRTRYGLSRLKLILADHGAGDRAIGFGESAAQFDHILAAGPKIRDRLIDEAGVVPEHITITGYPKFDLPISESRPFKFRRSDKPIVVYNPHLSPHLSSWYRDGRAVLDYFAASTRYNLIFAPHIMMFERRYNFTIDRLRMGRPGKLDKAYWSAPNIHVDIGSRALTDMSYMDCADVYLGDVSSQVYEFLRRPRPCVFLNSHRHAHFGDRNFAHWQAGPVIESVGGLDAAIADSRAHHASRYRSVQDDLFRYTFDLTDEPSSRRAARTLIALLSDHSDKDAPRAHVND